MDVSGEGPRREGKGGRKKVQKLELRRLDARISPQNKQDIIEAREY
jgi:hypothetical protein